MNFQLLISNHSIIGLLFLVAVCALAGCHPGMESDTAEDGADTLQEYAEPSAPPYDENADGHEQLAQAMARAKEKEKRVIAVWGANWCDMCRHLQAEFRPILRLIEA